MTGLLSIQLAISFGLAHQIAPAPHGAMTSILGISAGDPFDEAKETLERLAEPSKESNEGDDVVAFTLHGTPYKMVVLHESNDKVSWISAFPRDSEGIAFDQFGDLSKGKVTPSLATWEIHRGALVYRLLAQGSRGRAQVVTLLCPRTGHRD